MADFLQIVCPHCDSLNRVPAARLKDRPTCGNCKQSLFDAHPVELNAGNFMRHITKSDIPVLVDFWAPWCGPCRMVAPELQKVAARQAGKVVIVKVNTDELSDLGARANVRSIPTLALFAGGKEVARSAGARPADQIEAFISQAVPRSSRV